MSNIYKRIGECLDSPAVIDSVLAYDADEEKVLQDAGFVRCGSTVVCGEIVDIYKQSKEQRVFHIHVDTDDTVEFIESIKNELHKRKVYYKDKLIDAAYNPLSILEDYFSNKK